MRFHASSLVKAGNSSQSEENIPIFQLKSAFSTLILHSVGSKIDFEIKYLRRTIAFTPTSIATFNPIIYHLELPIQPLTENHAAHCYFGNTTNDSQTSTTMDDDFDPITVFSLPKKGLKIVELNTRSITNNLDQIRLLMHKKSIDITETWLDNSWTDNELVITGYNLFRRDRKTAQGGGIIVSFY